ncbi:hypothetical protein CGMCC3_g17173 [Colletotrichum fructicola]|uniref:Uncharacterized protein n=1 Tax=Colletotrichum fructicola (strain Nara gc5) TaxID=1213859 RepID=A0A7J6ID63_COLFN|nr:uncharacterized protein CGMCC3_g17173 [Colletotrichum fructicola]KAE9566664.1 hypothetical protein CGMCC3_g17173 [Colletotrichum fructicola]KAF4474278.1 hypothetical protein CGGC5_v017019 [Colletotrichum fructicola Nara gc5]KAF4880977.1 hypothetical protein CGCFRS4_v016019 [Colletotrichum fructicola]
MVSYMQQGGLLVPWTVVGFVLICAALWALDLFPVLFSPWVSYDLPTEIVRLKPGLLGHVEQLQEFSMDIVGLSLESLATILLDGSSKPSDRGYINKASCLGTIAGVWCIKGPEIVIGIALTLSDPWYAILAVPLTLIIWNTWTWAFRDLCREYVKATRDRQQAFKGNDEEEKFLSHVWYLRVSAQFILRRHACKFIQSLLYDVLLHLSNQSENTVATRLGHQLNSIHGTILKYLQAQVNASKIREAAPPSDFDILADYWKRVTEGITPEELLAYSSGSKESPDTQPVKRAAGPADLEAAADGAETPAGPSGPSPAPTYRQLFWSLMHVLDTAVRMTIGAFTNMPAGKSRVCVAHLSGYKTFAEDSATGAGSLLWSWRGPMVRDLARR